LGQDRAVMIAIYDRGGAVAKLWCVELVPKLRRFTRNDALKVARLGKGIPSNPVKAEKWMVQVIAGLADERTARFARDRQRLVVFRVKRRAAERARKETNEFWTGKVREVKIV
jgi:hypothetical protein